MPKILIITISHFVIAVASGLLLGLSSLGLGFTDSLSARKGYGVLVLIWKVLNAPAGIYVLHSSTPNRILWIVLQLLTSFAWANVFAVIVAALRKRRHNKPFEPTR